MIDWTKSMQQSFEYYIVDPSTWGDAKAVRTVKSCTLTRDLSVDTLGSASIECDEDLNDKYVRCYLIAIQNKETTKVPLGTYICQTPSTAFDGKRHSIMHDGYTPLIELKEKPMQIGFSARKNINVLTVAQNILESDSLRAPVVEGADSTTLTGDFLADVSDTRLSFVTDLLKTVKYSLGLDELGKVIFIPDKDLSAMAPVWTFTDDNSSILYPEFSTSQDIFGIPNKLEVIYSPSSGSPLTSIVTNEDPSSIVSHQSRGRWIIHRETDPDVVDGISQDQLNEYAKQRLIALSSVDYKLTYSHGYCPVRLGDCVRFNYRRADFNNKNAKVIRQVIRCEAGCPVEETAVLTARLWEVE